MAHPADAIIALANYLPPKRRCFECDYEKLGKFFYEQKEENPAALKNFNFNTNGMFPESEELRQALINLSACGLIVFTSGNPTEYHFSKSCQSSFKKFAEKRLTDAEKSELEEIAKAFNEKLAKNISLEC